MFSLQESNLALGNVVNVGGFPPKVSGNCNHLLFLADEESLSILNFSQKLFIQFIITTRNMLHGKQYKSDQTS